MKCKHCEYLKKLFNFEMTNREYWLFTEIFVYLHNGKDYCEKMNENCKNINEN